VEPETAGGGLLFDVGSHCLDIVDFLIGPIRRIAGFAENTGGAYAAEDVTAASFLCGDQVPGAALWNFNTNRKEDRLTIRGTAGVIATSLFSDADVALSRGDASDVFPIRNPPYVHQPLIQSVVDELLGRGQCASTGDSGARASWALEQCVADYYRRALPAGR
jgi:predicted dehydrogenase